MDPEIGRPIEEIGMVRGIEVDGGIVRVDVLITIEGCPLKDRITNDVTAAVSPLEGVDHVDVQLSPMSQEQRETLVQQLRGGANGAPQQSRIAFSASTSIVAVWSGKGGVREPRGPGDPPLAPAGGGPPAGALRPARLGGSRAPGGGGARAAPG